MRRAVLLVAVLALPVRILAQPADVLSDVRSLYESAAYDEALARMADLDASARSTALEQYRAFCLIALGRLDEATNAIERAVDADPDFVPSAADTSPRVRAMFENTRRKLLPAVIKRLYTTAKAAFSAGDFGAARAGFTHVLDLSNSLGAEAAPELADLKLVATEFVDLSTQRMSARSAPPANAAAVSPPPPQPQPRPAGPPIETTPAVALNQTLPPWTRRDGALGAQITLRGEVQISIDEAGHVVDARIIRPSEPNYDRQVLEVARLWRYTPAMRNGKPLPSEKVISYVLRPR